MARGADRLEVLTALIAAPTFDPLFRADVINVPGDHAVRLGIVDPEDEQPYIDVRLGRRAIEPIAAQLGITADALRMRLGRIDTRIADALTEGLLTGVASPQAEREAAAQAGHRTATRTGRANASQCTVRPIAVPATAVA